MTETEQNDEIKELFEEVCGHRYLLRYSSVELRNLLTSLTLSFSLSNSIRRSMCSLSFMALHR